MRFSASLVAIAAAAALSAPVMAQSVPSYLGTWVIESSTPAPWIKSRAELFEDERAALKGKRIVFSAKGIAAPTPMACRGPHYRIARYAPDMLFQGGLTVPLAQAAALGFRGEAIVTIETGCESDINYHFVDRDTALFALDNAIYRIRRVR